jgi:SAM-dependent methyltransferase
MTNLQSLKNLAKKTVPPPMYRWIGAQLKSDRDRPPVGKVDFGNLRRLTPISRQFGYDRGQPVGRYYVENFLARHAADVRGHVLEIGDAAYTRRFGGDRVTASDVFHAVPGNPEATYVGDLATADFIPSNTFDCFILTQTLLLIYDLPAAFKTIYRILKPGGVVLATLTGICQMVGEPWEANQCWSFTPVSAKRLFEEVFPASNVTVEAFGNVLSVVASLQGIAAEELRPEELDYQDDQYPLIITVKATKSIEDGEDKIDSENADCGQ